MPILFSYDIEAAEPVHRNRLQSMFERFGWERIGGSCYRYPTLQKDVIDIEQAEDWMNEVIPALMCFRSYVKKFKLKLAKYSLDSHVSTGSRDKQPRSGRHLILRKDVADTFGTKKLREWVDDVVQVIPY